MGVWLRGVAGVLVLGLVASLWGAPPRAGAQEELEELEELERACPAEGVPDAGFDDVEGGTHARAIECLVWWEIVQGFSAQRYGGEVAIRRDQIATMLANVLDQVGQHPGSVGDQGFEDIDGNVHAEAINVLASLGIVEGVNATSFAPAALVRRDQMASLLVRLHEEVFDPLPVRGQEQAFSDIGGNVHAQAVGKLVGAGITRGVTAERYAPARPVSRAQMASFVMRLVEVLLAGGYASPRQP